MLPNTPNAHLVSNGLRPIHCFTPAFHANVLLEGFLSDTPVRIGELLPAVAMSLDLERAADRQIRVDSSKYAVLENNLTHPWPLVRALLAAWFILSVWTAFGVMLAVGLFGLQM